MTTQIGWNDGTGEKIYLSYSASEGNQTVTITSDAHAGGTTISRVLTVVQQGKDITIITRNDVAMTENEVAVGYEQ